jgi:hypothetical protein
LFAALGSPAMVTVAVLLNVPVAAARLHKPRYRWCWHPLAN